MQCTKCKGKLEILRLCRKIRLQCQKCKQEYQVHEVAAQLDPETEEILARYTAIIYD